MRELLREESRNGGNDMDENGQRKQNVKLG
jgi:hypothetical protein